MRNRTRRRRKGNKASKRDLGPLERKTLSQSSASEFNMHRLAIEARSELAHNAAMMDARLTWAGDRRNGGKKFTRHTDGGPLQ